MTDEIRITRRIALEKYEFYEIEFKTEGLTKYPALIADIEKAVEFIRELMGGPTPEISQKIGEGTFKERIDDPYADLLIYEGNTVRLNKYLKDKEKWGEINTYLKGLGYNRIGAGKDSRWER